MTDEEIDEMVESGDTKIFTYGVFYFKFTIRLEIFLNNFENQDFKWNQNGKKNTRRHWSSTQRNIKIGIKSQRVALDVYRLGSTHRLSSI